MTKKQFLDAVNEIDDEFINDEIIDIPEEPQIVYPASKRVPFWRIAVSTAAAVCVLAAGFVAAAKLHGIYAHDPNASGASYSSISESTSSASASESAGGSEPVTSERLDLSERGGGVPFEARFFGNDQGPTYTDAAVKKDGEQYAALQIACRGVSEGKRLSLEVHRKGETKWCIGRTIITEPGTYSLYIDYVEAAETGEEYVLSIYCIGGEGNALIEGKWVP